MEPRERVPPPTLGDERRAAAVQVRREGEVAILPLRKRDNGPEMGRQRIKKDSCNQGEGRGKATIRREGMMV